MTDTQSPPVLPDDFRAEFESALTDRARWRVVARWFHVKPVGSNHDIRPGMIYFRYADEGQVICTGGDRPNVDPVPMTVLFVDQPMEPVSRKMLFEWGRNSQLFRLTLRSAPLGGPAPSPRDEASEPSRDEAPAREKPAKQIHVDSMIEMGSFTQLMTVAQQSGIVPAADQIAHVRDCEFRMGQYQTGFECIERLYVGFKQAADARMQRLRREEIDYKSGVLKMSAKEWQKKKHRDTVQTNAIERARRHFVRVLDGLRVLMLSE